MIRVHLILFTVMALPFFLSGKAFAVKDIVQEMSVIGVVNEAETETDLNAYPSDPHVQHGEGYHHDNSHGDEAHGKSEKAGIPQLDSTTFASQIFWVILTFSILYGMVSYRFVPAVSSILQRRREYIQNDLDHASKLQTEAEDTRQAYEDIMDETYKKSWNIIQDMSNNLEEKSEAALEEFRLKSASELDAVEKEIKATKASVMDDMHDIAAEVAIDATDKIAGIKTDLKNIKSVVQNIDKKAA